MTLPRINSYEIKISKTEEKIPVVNGVHLHSIYNPTREAVSLAKKNEDTLRSKNEVLILGLGFGYHISEIENSLREYHADDFKIVIIEPNQKVVDDYRELVNHSFQNTEIYSATEIATLYSKHDLVSFLIRKPGVIAHPASFNLYNEYFKSFLTYRAPTDVRRINQNIQNIELNNFLNNQSNTDSIDNLIDNHILKSELSDDQSFILAAFRELTRESESLQENTCHE